MAKEVTPAASLLIFADDWGRHPSSCQHLVRQLLPRHEVLWVNTIGTRVPRLDLATMRRGWEKARQWLRRSTPGSARPANPRVLNPRMWPWFSSAFGRGLNRRLLRRQLASALASLPSPTVAVTTLPVTADLVGLLPVHRWVYYCVDDFGEWPGLDRKALQTMERRLIEQADLFVAVSETLQEKLARHGRPAHLLTHGVEQDFCGAADGLPECPELKGLERPLVVFWGVVDARMDLAFLQRLGRDLQRGTIVLIGPEANPDPALVHVPRIRRLGSLPFAALPRVARDAAVLIMPYADLPVTRAIQPLKLKEYLATGKPAVVRDLPANRAWADCLDLAATPEVFSQAVRDRLQTGLPDKQRQARLRLVHESWAAKASAFSEWALSPPFVPLAEALPTP